jgi:Uma2 family endonuclease
MTPEEYLALPEEKPYLEYVDGMVVQKPMPSSNHAKLALEVGTFLRLWTREHGGSAGVEARMRLGDLPNYRLPDVSLWGPGRPSGDDTIPTLAVEIRSEGQTVLELVRKCETLRQSGVEACWLVDPIARTGMVFEAGREGLTVTTFTAQSLPGLALPLKDLFAVTDPARG